MWDRKIDTKETSPKYYLSAIDNLKNKGVEIIAAYKIGNQCGCCGVELTTSEIDKILSTKFQQCTYCDGVLV